MDTEAENPSSKDLDRLDALGIVRLMNREDHAVLGAVAAAEKEIAHAIDIVTRAMRNGGRLFYVGAGTSGRLGVLDAAECPPTFCTEPEQVQAILAGGEAAVVRSAEGAEDDKEQGARDLEARSLTAADVVVGISASGGAQYVLGAIERARQIGCACMGICCNADSPLAANTQPCIQLPVGPEVLAGSTRLKAGTATKMVLNMLSTGVMVRVGKTYGNLMVDVRASNQKLRARARRLVMRIAEVDEDEARRLLGTCAYEVKTAAVMARFGLEVALARDRLGRAGGRLGAALCEDQTH